MVPLGEVLAQDRNYIDRPEPRVYPKLSVKLYGKGVILDTPSDGATLRMQRHQLAKPGQVILSEIWGKKGAIGIVPAEGDGALCTSHFFLFDIRRDRVEPGYLEALFSSNYLAEQLGSEARGTTGYAAVRPQHLLAAKIPLPPLPEQRRIVARLEKVTRRIDELNNLKTRSRKEAALLWTSAARVMLRSLGEEKSLREVVTLQGGGTPSSSDPSFWEGPIPWVTPKDMKIREIRDAADHISVEATLNSPARLVRPGAVLIVVRGMILAHTVPVAVLTVPATINQDMKALIPMKGLSPDYLCAVLWAFNRELLELVARSTHDTRKLETARLLELRIPVPAIPDQDRIVAFLRRTEEGVLELRRLSEESVAETAVLLRSLLDSAFGEDTE